MMLRPGNAGSNTAADHILVLDAALAQIPAPWRTDILVSIDGAGASHDVITHLTALNTALKHGKRGRRVEYTIGWACDERTMTALGELPGSAWVDALTADGKADKKAQVADLTGILRHGPDGDRMKGWPPDQRVIARRTPRPAGKPAKLPRRCATASCTPPPGSPEANGNAGSTSRPPGPGPTTCPPPSTGSWPCRRRPDDGTAVPSTPGRRPHPARGTGARPDGRHPLHAHRPQRRSTRRQPSPSGSHATPAKNRGQSPGSASVACNCCRLEIPSLR
jgi:hypothetical protein